MSGAPGSVQAAEAAEAAAVIADPPPVDDAPKPSRRRPAADTKPKAPTKVGRPSKDDQLTNALASFIATAAGLGSVAVAGGLAGVDAPGSVARDLTIVAGQAQALAAALVKVSKTNPAVRKVLETAVASGAYGELAAVVFGGIALPIMANHGLMPPMLGGLVGTPEGPADAPPQP